MSAVTLAARALLPLALLLPLATGGHAAPARVAVLRDAVTGLDLGVVDSLSDALRRAGFDVDALTCDQIADPTVLTSARFQCLILTYSPTFPSVATDSLVKFLQAGGDMVLMGGRAFSDPVRKMGGQWLTDAGIEALLRAVPTAHVLFSFDDGDFSAWQRGTNKPEHPSKLTADAGKVGKCMRLDLKNLGQWQWDTFAASFKDGFPRGDNLLCFWAKGAKQTSQVAVEVDEKDGARWVAIVPLTTEWQRCVLGPDRFHYLADGAPKSRGVAGDRLHLENAARISFGLATGLTDHPDGDHTIWIDEVGSAHADIAVAPETGKRVPVDVFGDYEAYDLRDIHSLTLCPGQSVLAKAPAIQGPFAGTSAIGYAFANKSRFIPILSADDRYGRSRGWAAGLLVNYAGAYKGSKWLLYGIESPAFYKAAAFHNSVAQTLAGMYAQDLVAEAAKQNEAAKATVLALNAPAPAGFVRLSPDKKRFLQPNGKPLFLIGVNYVGPADRMCQLGGGYWDPTLAEADFRRAHEAGINCFRIWVGARNAPASEREVIRQCARKYGIYLVIHIGELKPKGEDLAAIYRQTAEWWKDEPMVIGYDLINEPQLSAAASVSIGGRKSPIIESKPYERFAGKFDKTRVDGFVKSRPSWPQVPGFVSDDDAREIYTAYALFDKYTDPLTAAGADYSTFPGVTAPLPLDGDLADFAKALNDTFVGWIKLQADAIREVDHNHYIAVGYNSILSCLPANRLLDFTSEHVYQTPRSYAEVMKNLTTLDRLAKIFPDQPMTIGEFGYTNGIRLTNGYLDLDTSGVGEMMHYLYAFSHGYSGVTKWMLTDWPTPMMRDNAGWMGEGSIYEERFGLYCYNGTVQGGAKPIVPALRFLRDYYEAAGPGGKIDVRPGSTTIGAVYVYRAPQALFVGDIDYSGQGLEFHSLSGRPANVMLRWGGGALRLMATCDARVRIDPWAFVSGLSASQAKVSGRSGSVQREGRSLVIEALAGETLVIGGLNR